MVFVNFEDGESSSAYDQLFLCNYMYLHNIKNFFFNFLIVSLLVVKVFVDNFSHTKCRIRYIHETYTNLKRRLQTDIIKIILKFIHTRKPINAILWPVKQIMVLFLNFVESSSFSQIVVYRSTACCTHVRCVQMRPLLLNVQKNN